MSEQSRYTVENHAERLRTHTHRIVLNPTHIPQTSDGTIPSHQMELKPRDKFDGSGSERWPNQGWTEAGDGTGYPGDVPNLPTQAQADAVAEEAQAERDERAEQGVAV